MKRLCSVTTARHRVKHRLRKRGRVRHHGQNACRLRLVPTRQGLDAVLLAIVESFASFVVSGEPERLKLCENPDCRWVFYDTTRSRTRRWCADTCGNLMKVRDFRARQKKKRKRTGRTPGTR